MDYQELEPTREFVCRLERGADWRREIEGFARQRGIDSATFHGLGSVENAELYFYDQERGEYDAMTFPEPLEVAACVGNVALLDGEPFAHTHAVCSRPDGSALAGHLNTATVFAGELVLRAYDEPLVREHDDETDLDLLALDRGRSARTDGGRETAAGQPGADGAVSTGDAESIGGDGEDFDTSHDA